MQLSLSGSQRSVGTVRTWPSMMKFGLSMPLAAATSHTPLSNVAAIFSSESPEITV